MLQRVAMYHFCVNCRIGSLENVLSLFLDSADVNCRIGSLEMEFFDIGYHIHVNCRIGSLEINVVMP